MLFGLRTRVGPRNHVLDGGPDPPHGRGAIWRGERAAHCKVSWLCGYLCKNGKRSPIVKYRDFLPWAVQKQLNRSICRLGCGLGWAEGSTSSIVFGRWCQCAQFQSYSPGGATYTTTLRRELRKNGWTDWFTVWATDSGGPKESQVQSYSLGGANVPTWNGTFGTT